MTTYRITRTPVRALVGHGGLTRLHRRSWFASRAATTECPSAAGEAITSRDRFPRRKEHPLDTSPHDVTAVFDEPNLVSCAGLAPVLGLAKRAGFQRLVADLVKIDVRGGCNSQLKVPGPVMGMVASADSIDDMDLLQHGAIGQVFAVARASSTAGTLLRAFTSGRVRQLW